MASSVFQSIAEAIETALLAEIASGQSMAFMVGEPVKVKILDGEPDQEPKANYKRHLITLYPPPDLFTEEPRLGGRVERMYRIGFALFRKISRNSRQRMFSDSATSYGVGMFEFANYVMDVLRNNTLSGTVNLTAGNQFSTPEIVDTGDDFLERTDFTYNVEVLSTVAGGVL